MALDQMQLPSGERNEWDAGGSEGDAVHLEGDDRALVTPQHRVGIESGTTSSRLRGGISHPAQFHRHQLV